MPHSIDEIARSCGLAAAGNLRLVIERPADPSVAGPDDLALAMSPDYAATLGDAPARAAVLWEGADWQALGLEAALFAPRARVAMAGVTALFAPDPGPAPGIHPTAVIDPSAELGPAVRIGPHCVVEAGVRIGAGSRLVAQVHVGRGAELGEGALLHPGVRIGGDVRIGARFIAQQGAVAGADGFSFVTPERGVAETAKDHGTDRTEAAGGTGAYLRIHSLGGREIGDDVDLGANACIDRGTVAPTRIGSGTKIDNLVQVGHNCQIGRHVLLCGQVGLAGSVRIGDRAVLGGKTGVGDNLSIGHDAVLAGGSLVGTSIPAGTVAIGAPAIPRSEFHRQVLAIRRLPRLQERVRIIAERLGL